MVYQKIEYVESGEDESYAHITDITYSSYDSSTTDPHYNGPVVKIEYDVYWDEIVIDSGSDKFPLTTDINGTLFQFIKRYGLVEVETWMRVSYNKNTDTWSILT